MAQIDPASDSYTRAQAPARTPDAMLDALALHWKPGPDRFLTRATWQPGAGPDVPALRHVCSVLDWDDARLLAEGVAVRQARGWGMGSVSYGAPAAHGGGADALAGSRLAADEVLLEGGPGQRALVSCAAFDRLMARLMQALIAGAENEALPETHSAWWPQFKAHLHAIQQRVG